MADDTGAVRPPEEAAGTPAGTTAPATPAPAAKPPEGFVPREALLEERVKRQELAAQLAEVQGRLVGLETRGEEHRRDLLLADRLGLRDPEAREIARMMHGKAEGVDFGAWVDQIATEPPRWMTPYLQAAPTVQGAPVVRDTPPAGQPPSDSRPALRTADIEDVRARLRSTDPAISAKAREDLAAINARWAQEQRKR
jgi:hypothetical protein